MVEYFLEVWYKDELVLADNFGTRLEDAVKSANKLAGLMLCDVGGSIVVAKKTKNARGFTESEELLEL